MALATEDLGGGKGLIVVSGAAFLSNFEVQATIGDTIAEKNYSNYKICENLVNYLNPVTVTDIADVQAQELEGIKYTIEGVVTSNASGYDKDTAFFDCIYVQDDTAGINVFPVAGNYQIGDIVRITGTTSSYQGERQLNVSSITKVGSGAAPAPTVITADQLNNGSVLGSLVTLKGTVVSFEEENGSIQTIMIRDSAGNIGRVFIDGYITSDKEISGLAVGCAITATGLASYDNTFNAPDGPFPRIRIRDRADIVCTTAPIPDDDPDDPDDPPSRPPRDPDPSKPDTPTPDTPVPDTPVPDTPEVEVPSPDTFTDLSEGAWYYDDVAAIIESGLMNGISDDLFAPEQPVTRGMIATILYRLSGENGAAGTAFPDVAADAWYGPAVAWASSAGVVNGLDTGLFAPLTNTTREQIVVMLYRYAQYQKLECTARGSLAAFSDSSQVSAYAQEAMEWAVAVGLIQGRDTLIAPRSEVLRSELCTMLVRFQALLA